ncbi:MAG: NAD(P)H-hydrate dehydratase [Ruminococcus sp.]|nr:NAD(P)H-hydrate dehydratase [Ruminococcus sp.]
MARLLTPEQMSQAEQTSEHLGTPLWTLMLNAGSALASMIKSRAAERRAKKILFLCGKGNNGGDGFVAAAKLKGGDLKIKVKLMCGMPTTELAKRAYNLLESKDFIDIAVNYDADIIVDCIFGLGFKGEFDDLLAAELYEISLKPAYRIACDMPSGINCCNGEAAAETLFCDETLTMHAPKLGMYLRPAKSFCGKISVADISIPNNWAAQLDDDTIIETAEPEYLKKLFPYRNEVDHKNRFGRLLMICGSENYVGAAAIASRAALRSGCGIVQLAAPKFVIQCISGNAPECVYTPLPSDDEGFISEEAIPRLNELIDGADAVVIGCGLGCTEGTMKIIEEIVKKCRVPLVIDADGINQLAKHIDVLREKKCEIILTPHIAELARLCATDNADAKLHRYRLARELCFKYGVTVHAKDATSITIKDRLAYVTDFGTSALAKGGSGDMLAGIIGSLLAQGLKPRTACMLGDYIMGSTAELLSDQYSPAAITASDIISAFKDTLTKIS